MTAFAADDSGYKVKYDGGSILNVKSGDEVKLYVEPVNIRLVKAKKEVAAIPASSVTEISYGQDVHRRVGRLSVLLLSHSELLR